MQKIAANSIRSRLSLRPRDIRVFPTDNVPLVMPANAKLLAWGFFLIYFIENGTLGLFPTSVYFVYRNIRISDFFIYGLTIYSLWNQREFLELYRSKSTTILKIIIGYLLAQFLVSTILYDYNILEYFFRLKGTWSSFLVFPYMLLLKRKGLPYLAKLILPVAIVSNILYILSAVTGMAFLPSIGIEKQNLPGGLEVYRVFGGTFFGELFFLGFIFRWITDRFRLYELFLVILFVVPHILAFGRSAWAFFSMTILIMFVWNSLRKREFKIAVRQVILIAVLGITVFYAFTKFVPRSDYLTEAITARIEQGEEDYTHQEGTYGSRLASVDALIQLWLNSNVVFGIGMHPLWVVKAVTVEESQYAWGFSDVGWAGVLAAYGAVGFLLSLIFQLYFIRSTFNILRRTKLNDLNTFLVLVFFSKLIFDMVISYSTVFFTCGLWGFCTVVFYLAAVVYKKEHPDE